MSPHTAPTAIHPCGPAADPKYLSAIHPSNPYNFSAAILKCTEQSPKVTSGHVFFFTHESPSFTPLACLSQWFPYPFTGPKNPYGDSPDETLVQFPTAEHFMMYHKALLMGDKEIAAKIIGEENEHPSRAKRLGREVRNYDGQVWGREADRVVEEGNWRKFSQHNDLKEALLSTEERMLVEASPEDRIWGIGFSADDAEGRESDWGANKLGNALMKVRDRIKKGT